MSDASDISKSKNSFIATVVNGIGVQFSEKGLRVLALYSARLSYGLHCSVASQCKISNMQNNGRIESVLIGSVLKSDLAPTQVVAAILLTRAHMECLKVIRINS